MRKWTPEPWRQSGNEIVGGDGTDAAFVVCKAAFGHISPAPMFSYIGQESADHQPVVDANMNRLVACVNACAGINPEAVPDLLAACKEAVQALAETTSNCHAFECCDDCIGCMAQTAHDGITAAIALAEGGAA